MNNSTVKVLCRDINKFGQGVCTETCSDNGKVIFANGILPGETGLVRTEIVKKSYATGDCIRVLSESEDRTEPFCTSFGKCGGCNLQHMKYSAQLRLKFKRVKNALMRIGEIDKALLDKLMPDSGCAAASPEEREYRAKSQIPVQSSGDKLQIGFYERGSHRVSDRADCPIQDRALDVVREVFRNWYSGCSRSLSIYDEETQTGLIRHLTVRTGKRSREVQAGLVLNKKETLKNGKNKDEIRKFIQKLAEMTEEALNREKYRLCEFYINLQNTGTNKIFGEEFKEIVFHKKLEEKIGELRYELSPESFFQVNPLQAENLFTSVKELLCFSTPPCDEKQNALLYDLYCGVGSIGLQLAGGFEKVRGCEISEKAVTNARFNAERNQIHNAYFERGKAEDLIKSWRSKFDETPSVIVVDPPRKGLELSLTRSLRESGAGKILYVSCDPETLARDLSLICRGGLYDIMDLKVFDMFPHTTHVETVVLVSREKD